MEPEEPRSGGGLGECPQVASDCDIRGLGVEGGGRKYSGLGQGCPRSMWVGEDTGSGAQLGKDSSRTVLSLIC